MDKHVTNYLLKHLPENNEWINELETQAKLEKIPIMDPVGMNFVIQLIRLNRPRKILEIGSAIGYSALRMAEEIPTTSVTTIEIDKKRYDQAINSFKLYNNSNNINIIYGDAIEHMENMVINNDQFDMVFIDAAKGKYKEYFNLADKLLPNNGVIIADNVLFRGYVSDETFDQPRYRSLVKKLREFNSWIMEHSNYYSSIVPIGDGIAISYKKLEESQR